MQIQMYSDRVQHNKCGHAILYYNSGLQLYYHTKFLVLFKVITSK